MDAYPGQVPYFASLRRLSDGNHFCGASIIRPKWVLSSAHCTEGYSNDEINVVVGSHLISSGGIHHPSDLIVNHPEYTVTSRNNDISLVRVGTPFTLTDLVHPIGIKPAIIAEQIPATVSGFGLLSVSYKNVTNM